MRTRVAALVGPTAAGKTALAVPVAEALGAEIVSLDSMQVYRGMDVGTDKVPAGLRERVPHHLIDVADPGDDITVAEFQSIARGAVEEITARGRLPLLVGGSGLYFRAVVDDLRFPPQAPEVRARLEERLAADGVEELHRQLRDFDPRAAAAIEPRNERRIVRALEVIELTGRPFSDNDGWDSYESLYDLCVAGVTRPRPELFARIEARVGAMLVNGLVDETLGVAAAGLGRTARQALGYRQVLEAPEDADLDDVAEAIIRATKRFARRQESWFRADPRVRWFDASAPETPKDLVSLFARALRVPLSG